MYRSLAEYVLLQNLTLYSNMDPPLKAPIPFILPALEVQDVSIANARHAFDKLCKVYYLSTRLLAYAMQNGISTSTIKAYLNQFDEEQLKEVLKEPVYSKVLGFGVPVLFYAVESRSEESIRMLYDFGVDLQARTTDWDIGVLAYTVLHARVDLRDTTELFRVLVALGADPTQIQKSLWEEYLTRMLVTCMKAQTPREKGETCIQNAIACAINVTQRYLLHIAHANDSPNSPSGWARKVARICGYTGVLELTYAIVGQPLAKKVLTRYLSTYYLLGKLEPKPLLFAFTGLEHHGKSALAKQLAVLLNCEYHYVDREGLATQSQLFGPLPASLRSGKAGSLNNLLFQNEGKRSVIYLDHFELDSKAVCYAIGSLLDYGVHTGPETRRETRPSMETIWILGTDLSSETLSKIAREHEMLGDGFLETAPFTDLCSRLVGDLCESVTPWLTSRLKEVVPFFSFSEKEAAVVAHGYFLRFIQKYREPRSLHEDKLIGDLYLDPFNDGELCKMVAEEYQVDLGAGCLDKAVFDILMLPITKID